jgi:hypothetical protein
MTVHTFGDCCCQCLPGDLPARMTSPGALNEVLRANWTGSGCCWSSTFNFNNSWLTSVSPACWTRNEAYNASYTQYIYPVQQRGPAPAMGVGSDYCVFLPAIMSEPEIAATMVTEWIQNWRIKVYLVGRLETIRNQVVQTEVSCAGSSGVKYVWLSTANYRFRYIQKATAYQKDSEIVSVVHPCWQPRGGLAAGEGETTDAQVLAELIAGTPQVGLQEGTFGFRSARVLDSLAELSSETFAPNVLSCAASLGCFSVPSTAFSDFTVNSVSVPTTGPTFPDKGVLPSYFTAGVRTLNLWDDARLAEGRVRNYADGTFSTNVSSTGLLITPKPEAQEGGSAGPNNSCAVYSWPCRTTITEGPIFKLRLDTLGRAVQHTATGTFSESPYSPVSASIVASPWVVNFG